jgi:hypothetical protein
MLSIQTDILGNQRTRGSNFGKFCVIEGITKPKKCSYWTIIVIMMLIIMIRMIRQFQHQYNFQQINKHHYSYDGIEIDILPNTKQLV